MEDFHDVAAGQLAAGNAVSRITLKAGETKLLALKEYNLGPPPDVIVSTSNPATAFVVQVVKLKDASKKKYIDARMSDLNDEMDPVSVGDWFFFQVCGNSAGTVTLSANLRGGPPVKPYANPVEVSVTANPKSLSIGTSFATLWSNHPLQPGNGSVSYPCAGNSKTPMPPGKSPPLYNMQCMVRLCTAFEKSNVNLSGMAWFTSCKLPGAAHKAHFSDPYDFPAWAPAKGQSYDFVATQAAPEPMPGLAAFWFVRDRTGVILFDHYFDVSGREPMFGGHIDLWNKSTMGNTINLSNVYEGLSAFLRAKKISFWPVA